MEVPYKNLFDFIRSNDNIKVSFEVYDDFDECWIECFNITMSGFYTYAPNLKTPTPTTFPIIAKRQYIGNQIPSNDSELVEILIEMKSELLKTFNKLKYNDDL